MTESPPSQTDNSSVFTFVVEEPGRRLDKVLRARVPDLSRTEGQRLIDAGDVTVDGKRRKPAYRVEPGDKVTVVLPPDEPEISIRPESLPLHILHEDPHLLVISKPANLVVHPGPGHPQGTLVNALLAHYPPIVRVGHRRRPGIVHRLDKDTSGVMVVAKAEAALESLQEQFRNREVEKTYLALVNGRVQPQEGIVEVPIGRHPTERQKMAPTAEGRYSRTRYRVIRLFPRHTLLEARPYTGRTHQVRVHLSWLGHPVVGDAVYGRRRQPLLKDRHFLHASRLTLTHPATGQEMCFEAPLPEELMAIIRRLNPDLPPDPAPEFPAQDQQES